MRKFRWGVQQSLTGVSSMTARVGPGLRRPPHYAISPSRPNFPAFWPRVNSWDTFVLSTVPVSVPSLGQDGYCVTATCNSVIKQTQWCGV